LRTIRLAMTGSSTGRVSIRRLRNYIVVALVAGVAA
jgi:hypothetical protein